jgi:hypothetical protein
MADLFAPPTPEELLDRKIEIVGILLNRFQEQLDHAATLDPRTLGLQKAEWIKTDLEDIATRIEEIKGQIYSKKTK